MKSALEFSFSFSFLGQCGTRDDLHKFSPFMNKRVFSEKKSIVITK